MTAALLAGITASLVGFGNRGTVRAMEAFAPAPRVTPSYQFCSPAQCNPPSGPEIPRTLPPLVDHKYADALADVPFHASRAPLNKKPDITAAGHYHRVGEIYLAHVWYTLKARPGKVSPEARKMLEKAHLYLYALRPLPRYPYWSKALYQDSMVLELLGNEAGKMDNLNLIARVKSSAEAASMARLYLAARAFAAKRCPKALRLLDAAPSIPERFASMASAIKIQCAIHQDPAKFINNIKQLYAKSPEALRP